MGGGHKSDINKRTRVLEALPRTVAVAKRRDISGSEGGRHSEEGRAGAAGSQRGRGGSRERRRQNSRFGGAEVQVSVAERRVSAWLRRHQQ